MQSAGVTGGHAFDDTASSERCDVVQKAHSRVGALGLLQDAVLCRRAKRPGCQQRGGRADDACSHKIYFAPAAQSSRSVDLKARCRDGSFDPKLATFSQIDVRRKAGHLLWCSSVGR